MKASLWAEILRLHEVEHLTMRAIARRLHCSRHTVHKALAHTEPPPAGRARRPSLLDPYRATIDALVQKYPDLSAVRIHEEIRKAGFPGEVSIVRRYVKQIRPARGRVYQEVDYPPGQAMQVDWGTCGTVAIGETRRAVSVFVAVLCYSRLLYIEFTLSQRKAHFYRCFTRALRFFQGSTERVIVDNLKTAVLSGSGRDAIFQTEFREFCGYHRLRPIACDKHDPESKGVVEGGVRYVKRNALKGRDEELSSFDGYQRLAVYWRDEIANVRDHRTTGQRPIDRFEKERTILNPLPGIPYDTDEIFSLVVTPHARVRFDGNRYSVPPEYTRRQVLLRSDGREVRISHGGRPIAHHVRSYDRRQLIVDPAHHKAALAMRKRSRVRLIEAEFDALGPEALAFRRGLLGFPVKPLVHLRRILGLVRLYGRAEVLEALGRAVKYQTFDAAYVQNLIDQGRRRRHLPSPLALTPKRRELIEEIQLDEPDPGAYDHLTDPKGDDP